VFHKFINEPRVDNKMKQRSSCLLKIYNLDVETIFQNFNMQKCKLVKVPIPTGVNLSVVQCPKTHEEEEDTSCVPYASDVENLMYQ
jgi:hypothetical protein